MTLLDGAALTLLLGILPALSIAQARALSGVEVPRLGAYLSSAVTLLALGAGAWALGARRGGPEALGLVPLPAGELAAWTAGLVAAGLALTEGFRRVGEALGARETALLRHLLPRGRLERASFAGLSLAAGFGEELAYRGYALTQLAPLLGPWGAAAATSVVFGTLHAYQGPVGMVRTAALGGLLAWGFLASGSLLPAILAHALLDVVLGIVLGERMMVPGNPAGVPERAAPGSSPATQPSPPPADP